MDTTRFCRSGKTYEQIGHDGAVVLFVGRLVEGKRPTDAVAAVQRLPESLSINDCEPTPYGVSKLAGDLYV